MMVVSPQPQTASRSAGRHQPWWQSPWFRSALLLLVGLAPVPLDLLHLGDVLYLHAAWVHCLAAVFCLVASRRFPTECMRWRLFAAATALHALSYVAAALASFGYLSAARAGWLGNLGNAAWMVLLIPALLGQRTSRSKTVRSMDAALGVFSVLLLMASFGSGPDPGSGSVRVWTGVVLLAILTVLALTLRIADARSGLRRFSRVMVRFFCLELADTVLINVVLRLYLPHTPDMIADVLIPLPELLLCYWVLETVQARPAFRFRMDRTVVDSMQPSVLTVLGVALGLYAFRHVPVLAAAAVIAVVLCYTVRTQAYYAELFHERSRLLSQTEKYQQLATRDPLTGIGNRRWLEASLQGVFSRPDAFPCTLLLVDTDHFKQVNDRHGHDAGDAVLCSIAAILQQQTCQTQQSCIARLGGDEFVALLRNVEEEEALALSHRIRAGVLQRCESLGYRVTVSIGATTAYRPVERKPWMEAADAALYRAKAAGRDTACTSALR